MQPFSIHTFVIATRLSLLSKTVNKTTFTPYLIGFIDLLQWLCFYPRHVLFQHFKVRIKNLQSYKVIYEYVQCLIPSLTLFQYSFTTSHALMKSGHTMFSGEHLEIFFIIMNRKMAITFTNIIYLQP